jgi:hypothetical protein
VRFALDQPFVGQPGECLADWRPGETDSICQLPVADHLSWSELAGDDGIAQGAVSPIAKKSALDPVQLHPIY